MSRRSRAWARKTLRPDEPRPADWCIIEHCPVGPALKALLRLLLDLLLAAVSLPFRNPISFGLREVQTLACASPRGQAGLLVRFALPDPSVRPTIMANLTECIQLQGVTPKPEHVEWLKQVAKGQHEDKGLVALAALCLGLMEYDKGTSAETREAAAKWYRKAARLGETGSPQGNKANNPEASGRHCFSGVA
ncbi:hypothetical protein WJX73_003455 [Symbiochloris irregularis]|uniref:Uncharacterized protein n=1 Tax=Symbiochloris irregularis TaxID=706552 RepID=A0AAW1PHW9_9CHLO